MRPNLFSWNLEWPKISPLGQRMHIEIGPGSISTETIHTQLHTKFLTAKVMGTEPALAITRDMDYQVCL